MSDGEALKLGRYNSWSNCLATLILATIRHRVLFSALFKIGLVKIVLRRLSQKQAIESIGRRYWLYQGPMMLCSELLHACGHSVSMRVGLYGCDGQDREGGIDAFQPKTPAVADNSTCLGGRRWGAYLRRNIRTYSSTSREVLSALMITHVSKHNDASQSGFTTAQSGLMPLVSHSYPGLKADVSRLPLWSTTADSGWRSSFLLGPRIAIP
jgi:hypothetical protein